MSAFNSRRRTVLRGAGATIAAGTLGAVPAFANAKEIRIGYVSPQTGPLAAFGEADKWVLAGLQDKFKAGVQVAGKTVPVKVIMKDSQSSPNRAGEVANDLILKSWGLSISTLNERRARAGSARRQPYC